MGGQQSSGIGAVRTKVPAPGGGRSPQRPGQTPDRSTIPGERRDRSPKATSLLRPLSQYGTAEEIMHVFRPHDGVNWTMDDFEQTGASDQEMLRANPADLPPTRPMPGFVLGSGMGGDRQAMLKEVEAELIQKRSGKDKTLPANPIALSPIESLPDFVTGERPNHVKDASGDGEKQGGAIVS